MCGGIARSCMMRAKLRQKSSSKVQMQSPWWG